MAARPFSYILISHSYPPVLGGSEVEGQLISDQLQKRGHQPRIVCGGGAPMPSAKEWVDPYGLRVRIYGRGRSSHWDHIVFALGTAWTLIAERRSYQVAYFLMQGLHLVTGLPIARLLGKPIVMKFSCSSFVIGMRDSWIGRLELFFLRRWASSILILNPGMMEEALTVGFDKARIGWMPNPVDTDFFCPCSPEQRLQHRRELNVSPDAPLAVFVGRLDHQKKLPWLVGAFSRVVKERPDAILALVGDGSLRDEITRLVSDLNLERSVIFTGRMDRVGVLKWLQASDVFTLVSAIEGLPCSLIEAMSTGVPAVVSDIAAHTQLVTNEVEGVVTELGNEESIARGFLRMFNDPAARDRMGIAARERMLKQFSTAKVVDRYVVLFDDCIAKG